MTVDEAKTLLSSYHDGLLEPSTAREVERLVREHADLQDALRGIREEEALLSEALAPLKPSRSARMRLSEAMLESYRRAERMANTLPERGWRIFRFSFAGAALAAAMLLWRLLPPTFKTVDESLMFYTAAAGGFVTGLVLLLAGRSLAFLESRMLGSTTEPSRLGILMLEVFGVFCVLASVGIYIFLLAR